MSILDWEAIDGEDPMGSVKHGTIQSNIAGLLTYKCDKKIRTITELSLDISNFDFSKYNLNAKKELESDISGYFVFPQIPDGEEDIVVLKSIG